MRHEFRLEHSICQGVVSHTEYRSQTDPCTAQESFRAVPRESSGHSQMCLQRDINSDDQESDTLQRLAVLGNAVDMATAGGPVAEGLNPIRKESRVISKTP
jgi:hypothetical protein